MQRAFRSFPASRGAVRLNCLAALICLAALVILVLNFQASPAGAGSSTARKLAQQTEIVAAPAQPAPQKAAGEITPEQVQSAIRSSRFALQLHVAQLEIGLQKLTACPSYTATLTKQERLDGDDLGEAQTLTLKLRHEPLSIYMKWLEGGDVGREILFVENQYDGKLLIKLGGLKRAMPAVKLEPNSALVMAETRHPPTEAGLKFLTEQALKFRKRDLELKSGVRWEMLGDQTFAERTCDCFIAEYEDPSIEPAYRKTVMFIDRELSVPICVKNFAWPTNDDGEPVKPVPGAEQLDENTLIEFYAYTDLKLTEQLADADFDKTNTQYKFKR